MADNSDNSSESIFRSVIMARDNKSPLQKADIARWSRTEIRNIDALRWNRYYPYQFLVVEETKNGDYVKDSKWVFTLPFPPESIDYNLPMATTLTTTLNGTIEENNGIPIRPITLSGTLGVMPLRDHAEIREHTPLIGAIFGGTIQNGVRLANNFITPKENLIDPTLPSTTTGYYQMRLLKQFFEDFMAMKKTKDGSKRFLAFTMNKDEAIYLVSVNNCIFRKTKDSPLEYMYHLSMQAYKRITINGLKQPFAESYAPTVRDPNKLAQMLAAINKARKALADARSTLEAVRGDIDAALFEPLRQVTLFAKELMSLPLVTADLPKNILDDCRYAIIEWIGVGNAISSIGAAIDSKNQDIQDAANKLAQVYNEQRHNNILSTELHVNTNIGKAGQNREAISQDEAMDVFNHPDAFYDLFNNIPVSDLKLHPTILGKVKKDRFVSSQKTRKDFEEAKDQVSQVLADFEAAVNLGDATYSTTYGLPSIAVIREATKEDYRVIYHLNDVITNLSFLAATREINQFQVKSVDIMAGLAARSGIAFQRPASKYSVPFPYGSTLETLSYRYLGTPDRWLEIAALNGLRAPYVDETGFSLPLLTNGKDNNIIVSSATNLAVGQQVTLYSTETTRTTRRINSIIKLADGQYELVLDGDSDLSNYTTFGRANLHAFLPGTVNSQRLIYIPSEHAPDYQMLDTKDIPGIDHFDPLIELGGIDMLLSETNDIVMTPDGDNRWAIGLTNIIQMTRIELSTLRGKLMDHPGFGFPIQAGVSNADVSGNDIVNSVKDMFGNSPYFEALENASVTIDGGGVGVSLSATLKGTAKLLPLMFRLPS
jgi:hypothetical protein